MPIILIIISKAKLLEVKQVKSIESMLLRFVPEAWGVIRQGLKIEGKKGDEMILSLVELPQGNVDSTSNSGWVLQQAFLYSSEHPPNSPGGGSHAAIQALILFLFPPVLKSSMLIWTHLDKQFNPDLISQTLLGKI